MKTYTIEQIKNYLAKSDSLGDALYFCDEEHLDDAQIDSSGDENDEERESYYEHLSDD